MAFLQKVSFCNLIRTNPCLFSACRRKKVVITVASFIIFLLLLFCSTVPQNKKSEIPNGEKIYYWDEVGELLGALPLSDNNRFLSLTKNSKYIAYKKKIDKYDESNITNTATVSDTEMLLVSDNYKYALWSIVTVIAGVAAIKTFRSTSV